MQAGLAATIIRIVSRRLENRLPEGVVHFQKTLGAFLSAAGIADERGKAAAMPRAASAAASGVP